MTPQIQKQYDSMHVYHYSKILLLTINHLCLWKYLKCFFREEFWRLPSKLFCKIYHRLVLFYFSLLYRKQITTGYAKCSQTCPSVCFLIHFKMWCAQLHLRGNLPIIFQKDPFSTFWEIAVTNFQSQNQRWQAMYVFWSVSKCDMHN